MLSVTATRGPLLPQPLLRYQSDAAISLVESFSLVYPVVVHLVLCSFGALNGAASTQALNILMSVMLRSGAMTEGHAVETLGAAQI